MIQALRAVVQTFWLCFTGRNKAKKGQSLHELVMESRQDELLSWSEAGNLSRTRDFCTSCIVAELNDPCV